MDEKPATLFQWINGPGKNNVNLPGTISTVLNQPYFL